MKAESSPLPEPPPPMARTPKGARFTSENARFWSIRGLAARRAIAATPPPAPEPSAEQPQPQADMFSQKRLVRVRSQLTRIDNLLASESDPAKIDRLAAASSKLEEQERRLSDRSLPVVRRVAEVKASSRSALSSPPDP